MENRWEWSENRWERGGQVAVVREWVGVVREQVGVWTTGGSGQRTGGSMENKWEWSENSGSVEDRWQWSEQVGAWRIGGSVEDRWQWSENRWECGEQVAVVREQWERGGQVAVVEEQVGSAAASQGRLAAPTRPEPCAESPLSTLLDPGSPAHLAGFMRAKVPVLRAHP
ncbi:uncharacterized protein LOC121020174 isoform X28 [Herpailurus yagouaroundi]|uniref:uncharacterized protein LOC121020174 isoform X28 n=1 Tax=Herpailurus yagouaroundi TaxID=1608482 RepID=UPI001AD7AA18|nr:uncharacterized protein LOC121020174 isoform X28 [Puma yagouaroundi]